MATDRAQITYYKPRKYRELVNLQGRVLLEADSNEGQRTFTEELRQDALDFVGPWGTPDDGYSLTPVGGGFQIEPGTMYVGGLRTTLEQAINYSSQPDWLDTALPPALGDDLWCSENDLPLKNRHVLLVLREQEITAVEDPALREVALGGPDSAARTRLLQRIVAASTGETSCAAARGDLPAFWSERGLIFDPQTAALQSRARLQVTPVVNPPPPSPCDPPSASGYLGADNQLIRIQVVAFDKNNNRGKLLWGYHNASTLYRTKALDGTTVEFESRPVSAEFQPRSGQVVQLLLSAADLGEGAFAAGLTGHCAKLASPYDSDTRRITLPAAMPAPFQAQAVPQPLFLRLWEDLIDFDLNTPVELAGTGLQVTLSGTNPGELHLGDHWSIAVRPLTPNAVYPERYLTAPQPPDGPRMWACPLAVLSAAGGKDDCRLPFDNLPELTARKQDSCCCITVRPQQARRLQDIINRAVDGAGGAQVLVHLEPGVYKLPHPLLLDQRHKGIVIAPCAGAAPVITADPNNKAFAYGLILVLRAADVTIRGLELDMVATQLPDDLGKLFHTAVKSGVPSTGFPPRTLGIGIRAVQCLSLSVEDCVFRMPKQAAGFGAGLLIQGDNGNIECTHCRFVGEGKKGDSVSIGICLAPIPVGGDGALQPSSAELLRIEKCVFSLITVGILLSGQPLQVSIESNTTRSVHSSLLIFWYSQVNSPSEIFRNIAASGREILQKHSFLGSALSQDHPTVRAFVLTLFLALGDYLAKQVDVTARHLIYALGDLRAAALTGNPLAVPDALQLTMESNQFESLPILPGGDNQSGVDTLVWDLTSTAVANITGNTLWNNSPLPTAVVLFCRAFNITGNMIGNRSNSKTRSALLVWPGNPQGSDRDMFTVTGNTIFGATNLAGFPRKEWSAKASSESWLLTWEFFNSIE